MNEHQQKVSVLQTCAKSLSNNRDREWQIKSVHGHFSNLLMNGVKVTTEATYFWYSRNLTKVNYSEFNLSKI
jgi:hypothetical protein